MEEGLTQYFSRKGPTYESFGSIDASRMEAMGFGGKKAIYGKFDNLAYKNVRVEIEILAD